jgi:hypothetical protein
MIYERRCPAIALDYIGYLTAKPAFNGACILLASYRLIKDILEIHSFSIIDRCVRLHLAPPERLVGRS